MYTASMSGDENTANVDRGSPGSDQSGDSDSRHGEH